MLDRRMVFEIHRLVDQGLSERKIAGVLGINRKSVAKYLAHPHIPKRSGKPRSKLDPYQEEIQRLLQIDPYASAVVIRQRLCALGFDGGVTIVKDYLAKVRKSIRPPKPHIRFESEPGQQCQIDWGHFGSLVYGRDKRKLYCLAVLEAHSRLLFLEFTHSQKQESLHRSLLKAWQFLGGTPRQIVVDNMITAVTERVGSVIRFNEAFLEFLRPFKVIPHACHPGRPQEKGKVENVIKYIKGNFWPLRSFVDLADVQAQADLWRDQIANQRVHFTTGQPPCQRFSAESMRPLPEALPDCREKALAKVQADFSVRFDGNTYSVPPGLIGKRVLVKADPQTITIYDQDRVVGTHPRSWEKGKRIELPRHREEAIKKKYRDWLSDDVAAFLSLGEEAGHYLQQLAASGRSLKKSVKKLLALKDEYGPAAIIDAIRRAAIHGAFGADYIENILYQDMTPITHHLPVRTVKEDFNHIRLEEPSLAEYDALVIQRRSRHE